MNYYSEIKNKLIKNEISKKAREIKNNQSDLTTYFEVGKLLSEAGKHYGDGIIKKYAIKLEKDIGKKYNERTLRKYRQFYTLFNNQKWPSLPADLNWSHYQELLSIRNINEIRYYIDSVTKYKLSFRKLREKIRNKEYQRLDESTKLKLINHEETSISDFIKEPIILNKTKDYDKISEIALKEIILNDLDNFLNQLGSGFTYVGNEYPIKMGNTYNYIDILLFNFLYNAFVVVELKVNKLRKQDIGQIEIYMNYINENVKTISQDKTIGIIVCKENDKYIIKYSTDTRIYTTTYKLKGDII